MTPTMLRRTARVLVSLFFVLLLATPFAIKYWSSDASPDAALDPEAAIERYGFALNEVSNQAGIDFTHQAPNLDPKLGHIMPEVASLGASVSVADFDRDGLSDLYVTSSARGTQNALYRNQGDGSFENVASEMGIADLNRPETGTSMGTVWGDYDNDGYEDLFLYRWGRPELFHNDQGQGFTRVTQKAGLTDWLNADTAIWLDYDRDGLLDLFVGGFYPEDLNLWNLETTRMMPDSYEYASNGGRNYLFRNEGGGAFKDVAPEMGLTSTRWTLAAAAADLNGDGWDDLFLANDFGIDELYINEKGERFRDAGRASNVSRVPESGMNAAFGDVLNQGEWGLYVSNLSEEGVLIQGNNLWVPSSSSDETPEFKNLAGAMGVELAGWSYGAQFGDLNNDGWQDLFVTNGFYSGDKGQSYWYDFSKVAGGHSRIIADAENWPAMNGRSLSGYERNRIWLNDGAGRFQEAAQAVGGATTYDGRAVAFADLWNRGVLDIIVAHQRGPVLVYENTVAAANNWIAFDLTGAQSNRSAIGAQLELRWKDGRQVQQVTGGSGFSAQNQRRLHFGLGAGSQVEKAVIRWPSGAAQTLNAPAINTVHHVEEPR